MKKLEVLQGLPRCDTETRNEQKMWENVLIDLLEAGLQEKQYPKYNQMKFNEMRYTSALKLETKIMCRS